MQSKKQFDKKLKDAVAKVNKLKASFDELIANDNSTPQAVVSLKEDLDGAFAVVYSLCERREQSLVESSRNAKEKNTLVQRLDKVDAVRKKYTDKYNDFL